MFSIDECVTASKTNENGVLKTVSIIDMMQDCSQLWLQSEAELNRYFTENSISQLLAFRQIDILRRPIYGEKLKVITSVFDCRSFYGFRNTVIYDESGEPCMKSWSMGAFVSLKTNQLAKVPKEILDGTTLDDKIEMEYLDRKIDVPNFMSVEMTPQQVMRNDIDMNHHMNNAHYIRLAAELIPKDYDFKRMRIEYKMPASEGAWIYPKVKDCNDERKLVLLCNDQGQAYSIVEFS